MKKGKEKCKVLLLSLVLGLLASGCGSASSTSAAQNSAAYDTAASIEIASETGALAEEYGIEDVYDAGAGTVALPAETQRKLIKNVDLEVETENFDDLLLTVGDKTDRLGGYIEESYNGSNYYGRGTRNASLTIRIPAEKLNEFLSDISDISNVVSRNESVTDVTLQYVDMESHKKVLLAEQERLLELLEQAENIEDIINLESRLSEVRYQIESMESQLRILDNQVSYSTVYLYIDEVTKLTPVKEQSVWEKISTGFVNSLHQVGDDFVNFVIGLIIALPYLIVWAVIILILVLIIRFIIRRRKKKKQNTTSKEEERKNE